jgi:2-amino-4-hydroxy-6-hydroxymethyldihydropteridine diphosphokinase
MAGQPDFYNAALRLEFAGAPLDLLGLLMEIEREQGRERREHWGPRTLDLDLLWIAGQGVESSLLQVPHPRLLERAFALVPLLSLVPTARDPRTGQDYLSALLSLGTAGLEVIDDTRWDAACVQLASH